MTEDEILAGKPYTDPPADLTIEDRANDLVNALMHQLRSEYGLVYAIDNLTDPQKAMIHDRLVRIAAVALRGEPLVEQPLPAPASVPPLPPLPSAGLSGQPLDPDMEGEAFIVQIGAALMPEQAKP